MSEVGQSIPFTDILYLPSLDMTEVYRYPQNTAQNRPLIVKVCGLSWRNYNAETPSEQFLSFSLVLDRTIFHPQGGGQPSDVGVIRASLGHDAVNEAFLPLPVSAASFVAVSDAGNPKTDGHVEHVVTTTVGGLLSAIQQNTTADCAGGGGSRVADVAKLLAALSSVASKTGSSLLAGASASHGTTEQGRGDEDAKIPQPFEAHSLLELALQEFLVGRKTLLQIDGEKRRLYARLHTAGHLLDMAAAEMRVPGAIESPGGASFPDNCSSEWRMGADERKRIVADKDRYAWDHLVGNEPRHFRRGGGNHVDEEPAVVVGNVECFGSHIFDGWLSVYRLLCHFMVRIDLS